MNKKEKREIKFRVWNKWNNSWLATEGQKLVDFSTRVFEDGIDVEHTSIRLKEDYLVYCQYTGLKDKNGKEIYELMELDGKYEVDWLKGRYILREISGGDIIDLNYENQYEITREYTKI